MGIYETIGTYDYEVNKKFELGIFLFAIMKSTTTFSFHNFNQ